MELLIIALALALCLGLDDGCERGDDTPDSYSE